MGVYSTDEDASLLANAADGYPAAVAAAAGLAGGATYVPLPGGTASDTAIPNPLAFEKLQQAHGKQQQQQQLPVVSVVPVYHVSAATAAQAEASGRPPAGLTSRGSLCFVSGTPYEGGVIPADAIFSHPTGRQLRATFFGDTPAPFTCPCCGFLGLTDVRSSLSAAAVVAAAVTIVGVCFLAPGSCMWHKRHYCPCCQNKVGEHQKDDMFLVADPVQWHRPSFALPL
ncbi:hypothetical protein CLOM_g18613 [Closterium sp. NIES-68]|nr:hypothetical protein CLOM_g18613 [Closterium sp. NIES-68]GJP86101.1 hypothetical protein CLOP_g16161 [Closterium sp. NIES-67]